MLVCHCKGLSDRDIRDTIRAGACSRRQVRTQSGAGGRCGGCRPVIQELLDEERARDDATLGGLGLVAAR